MLCQSAQARATEPGAQCAAVSLSGALPHLRSGGGQYEPRPSLVDCTRFGLSPSSGLARVSRLAVGNKRLSSSLPGLASASSSQYIVSGMPDTWSLRQLQSSHLRSRRHCNRSPTIRLRLAHEPLPTQEKQQHPPVIIPTRTSKPGNPAMSNPYSKPASAPSTRHSSCTREKTGAQPRIPTPRGDPAAQACQWREPCGSGHMVLITRQET